MFNDSWRDPVTGKIYSQTKNGWIDDKGIKPEIKKKQSELTDEQVRNMDLSFASKKHIKEYSNLIRFFEAGFEDILRYEKLTSWLWRTGLFRKYVDVWIYQRTKKKYDKVVVTIATKGALVFEKKKKPNH